MAISNSRLKRALIGYAAALALTGSALGVPPAASKAPEDPAALVRQMVDAELKVHEGDHTHWAYQLAHTDPKQNEVRSCIETDQGLVCRKIAVDGKPLSAEEQKKEDERIRHFISDPREQQARQKERDKDGEKAAHFMKMLPEAFLYQYDGTDGNCIRLKFSPNPNFDASSWESRVFHAMAGYMWIDSTQKRLARLKGELISKVEFGGGLLGRLEKGGRFEVQRIDLGQGRWETRLLDVHIDGKALCFKTIRAQESEISTNFKRVPEAENIAQAVETLIPASY